MRAQQVVHRRSMLPEQFTNRAGIGQTAESSGSTGRAYSPRQTASTWHRRRAHESSRAAGDVSWVQLGWAKNLAVCRINYPARPCVIRLDRTDSGSPEHRECMLKAQVRVAQRVLALRRTGEKDAEFSRRLGISSQQLNYYAQGGGVNFHALEQIAENVPHHLYFLITGRELTGPEPTKAAERTTPKRVKHSIGEQTRSIVAQL